MLERVRVAPVDLVGHALHRPHPVLAQLDALLQRVVDKDARDDREDRNPGPPHGAECGQHAHQVEARELDVNQTLGFEEQRERAPRRRQRDGQGHHEHVHGVQRDCRRHQDERVLRSGQAAPRRHPAGSQDGAGRQGGKVRLAAVEDDVDSDRAQGRSLARGTNFPKRREPDIDRLQAADKGGRLPDRQEKDSRKEDRAGHADLGADVDVERKLERQDRGHCDRGDQPPVGRLHLQAAAVDRQRSDRRQPDGESKQLGAPARRQRLGLWQSEVEVDRRAAGAVLGRVDGPGA